MRITGGLYRGFQLKSKKGLETRPSSDRVKEAIFSSITFKLPSALILDLFAGSGALALDALSRGGAFAWIVEKDKEAFDSIMENVKKLDLKDQCRLIRNSWEEALILAKKENLIFDLIFLDPPYYGKYLEEAIKKISNFDLLSPKGVLIAETFKKNPCQNLEDEKLEIVKEALYGDTKILYFQKRGV